MVVIVFSICLFLSLLQFLFFKLQSSNFIKKKMIIIIVLVIFLVDFKNIIRINKEFHRDDFYNFKNFPFFAIREKDYTKKNLNQA